MMKMKMKLLTICALAGAYALAAVAAGAATKRLTLDDLPKIAGVSQAAISPDGKQIAYTLSRANMKDDRYDLTLELYDVAGKTSRALSFERRVVASPAWSPDGRRLAFIALRGSGKDATLQVYVMDMRGGDPVAITDSKQSVQQFAWRPDGSAIAYVKEDANPNEKDVEKHLDAFVVGDQAYLERSAPMPSHIWIVDADGSHDRRITSGSWSLPQAAPPSSPGAPLSWSPDGTRILFTRQANPYYGDSDRSSLAVVNVATGAVSPVTTHTQYEGLGEYSPDGTHIAYWYPHAGNPAQENDIFVVASSSRTDGTDVSGGSDLDTNVQRAIWMPDGKALLLAGHKQTDAALWLKPIDGAPARRVALGPVQPSQNFWLDGSVAKTGAIAFAGNEANHPTELYYMASATAPVQRVTSFNDDIAAYDLGSVRRVTWNNEGFDEDGVVTLPPGYDASKRYPMVLVIHGGPNSASILTFSSFNQILAARGYIVFNPNYRGSDNLGAKYWYGIWNDAGAGPGRDVMAGVAAVEKDYSVDTSRIGVSGWSYGGYMTSWMEGHYHVWKAAVAGAAVNNWIDEYDLSDNNVGVRFGFEGSPYVKNNIAAYRAQSPVSYAWDITTPTLILSDVGDARVPITQSYEMFRALTTRGTPVKFFAYPVNGHFPSDPVRAQDVYRRWSDWLDRYLK